jgi:hypothetical protein
MHIVDLERQIMKRINPKTSSAEAVRVQERLDQLNLGWPDLRASMDVQDQNLYYWRKKGIPKAFLKPVCEYLGCTVDWLLSGEHQQVEHTDDREFIANLAGSNDLSETHIALLRAMAESLMERLASTHLAPPRALTVNRPSLH